MARLTQRQFVLDYYAARPGEDISHEVAVDWLTTNWTARTGKVLRDPDRMIRLLHQEGYLKKIRKGVYRYAPSDRPEKRTSFTPEQKLQILKRDGYRCKICGRGESEGVELHIDHKLPVEHGGESTLDNGQVLCGQHNYMKKTYSTHEFGKRFYIDIYNTARKEGDERIEAYSRKVLDAFEEFDIASHIKVK